MQVEIPLIGRETELYQVVRNLSRGRHTLLVGEKGIGKSRLLGEARAVLEGSRRNVALCPRYLRRLGVDSSLVLARDRYRIITVWHSSPLGECLRRLCEAVHGCGELRLDPPVVPADTWPAVRKRLVGLGSAKVQDLLIESINSGAKPYLIFFDSWDRITPSHQSFIERLLSVAVVCAAVSRVREEYYLKKIWSSCVRVDIPQLSGEDSELLVRVCMELNRVRTLDPEFYRREVLKTAHGNPFRIITLVWHGSREATVDRDQIRGLRREDDGDFFNMGPVYVFGAASFTLIKIFSLGLDNQEAYIFFSALGFVVYFVFRVFRNFFLFRPQKRK